MSEKKPSLELQHTQIIHQLCQTPREERGEEWRAAFLQHIPTASLAAGEPQVTAGPDGFPYFNLFLPPEGEAFEPFSVAHINEHCSHHGFGVSIFIGDKKRPDWVFSFGDIWNYRETGQFYHDPPRWGEFDDGDEAKSIDAGEAVLIAQPSETYLPEYVRHCLATVLSASFQIAEPQVFLLTEDSLSPTTNLVFNIFPDDFEDEELFAYAKTFIAWSLPRDYGIVEIPPDSELIESFEPLLAEQS